MVHNARDTPGRGTTTLAFSVRSAVLVAGLAYRRHGSAPQSLTNVSRLGSASGSLDSCQCGRKEPWEPLQQPPTHQDSILVLGLLRILGGAAKACQRKHGRLLCDRPPHCKRRGQQPPQLVSQSVSKSASVPGVTGARHAWSSKQRLPVRQSVETRIISACVVSDDRLLCPPTNTL